MDKLTARLANRKDLTRDEMDFAISQMLSGDNTDAQNAEFLSKLAEKGETDEELLGMLDGMQKFATRVQIKAPDDTIDMCGTGGDRLDTFNVSTASSFVVAAAGGIVAKHGNRSSSGGTGSADIFEGLGYNLEQTGDIAGILDRHGIAFMFAQKFHPAMRHVAGARKMIHHRTAFNLLGPLSNPAGVKNQLVGVSSSEMLGRMLCILKEAGAHTAMTVSSENGMDELSTISANRYFMLHDGKTTQGSIKSEELGLHKAPLHEIQVKPAGAMMAFWKVVNGTANRAMLETSALNAAAGLLVGGVTNDIRDGVELALNTIKEGKAKILVEKFVADVGDARIILKKIVADARMRQEI